MRDLLLKGKGQGIVSLPLTNSSPLEFVTSLLHFSLAYCSGCVSTYLPQTCSWLVQASNAHTTFETTQCVQAIHATREMTCSLEVGKWLASKISKLPAIMKVLKSGFIQIRHFPSLCFCPLPLSPVFFFFCMISLSIRFIAITFE